MYHKPLSEFLIEEEFLVVYVTNEAIKKNRALLDGRWDKNDTKDAANVADLLSQGKCQYYDLPDMNLRDVRSLLLLRTRLMKQQHSARIDRLYVNGNYEALFVGLFSKRAHLNT